VSPAGSTKTQVEISGRQLTLSNLDKVLYPESGFTKGQVVDYYARIAPVLVPHLDERPVTLKRYPNGVEGQFFYEKNCPKHRPDWVSVAPLWSSHSKRDINYCLVDDVSTLVWLANLAALELHPSLSKKDPITQPTMVVFDLDPGPPADIRQCCEVAMHLRELFDTFELQSFPKTSGSKGLQIYVPLNSEVDYDSGTKPFALAVAQYLEKKLPDLVVSNMAKDLRHGKVLVDWSQNDESKTTVGVYSLRARPHPTVSTPVTWDEVEIGDPDKLRFEASAVLERVETLGDLFAPTLSLVQELPRFGR
jgi:bifunctional non-homologous end joining protein LigD